MRARFWLACCLCVALCLVAPGSAADSALAVPTSVKLSSDAFGTVDLCVLNYKERQENPSATARFRKWASVCTGESQMTMNDLIAREEERGLTAPRGFVFQASRCGSTLVANMFAAAPSIASFSESEPPKGVLNCARCTEEYKVRALRAVLSAMSNTGVHRNGAVFKLQSTMTLSLKYYLQAFPEVPWVFLYRDPIEIMQSHAVGPGPCSRGQKRVRPEVQTVLGMSLAEIKDASSDTYCAGHTAALFNTVLEIVDSGKFLPPILLNYVDLPDAVPKVVAPALGVSLTDDEVRQMQAAATVYSKGDNKGDFVPDSEKKQMTASKELKAASERFALPLYSRLERLRQTELYSASEEAEEGAAVEPLREDANTGPAADYPQTWSVPYDILAAWHPDDPEEPADAQRFNSLRYFDYHTQLDEAIKYRDAELPFVITGFPDIAAAGELWTDDYLEQQFGVNTQHSIQQSQNNHFMYWRQAKGRRPGKKGGQGGRPLDPNAPGMERPYTTLAMTYREFSDKAKRSTQPGSQPGPKDPHLYLQTGSGPRLPFIGRDLPFFLPKKSFWMVDPAGNTGIHCRFGMRGVIAECHYDGRRNFIGMIRGRKRYVISPPSECKTVHMYQRPHPSARHTAFDWSNWDPERFPDFKQTRGLEVVLRAGQIMYLPSYWLHFIVSLDQSVQCNSRSGHAQAGRKHIEECGFYR